MSGKGEQDEERRSGLPDPIREAVDRLDELGLDDVEPATAFGWR